VIGLDIAHFRRRRVSKIAYISKVRRGGNGLQIVCRQTRTQLIFLPTVTVPSRLVQSSTMAPVSSTGADLFEAKRR
jgi:hypothetical protein